jgi:F-type H+-transporting ATPase subunit alpha
VVVLDDLTKHAATHREIALLTGQPPGREAYPGDVFSSIPACSNVRRVSRRRRGGSLTALPIAETDAGNVSAYIPTNLISITDGQIILDAKLFAQGHKPAIDVGTSVSRVGGKTQLRVLRDASGTMRLDYAQFLELEMFTRFGEQPEPRVRAQIERGKRLRALLVQPLSSPLRVVDQVALVVALGEGLLDGMAVSEISSLRTRLPAWIDDHVPDLCAQIERTGQIDTAQRSALMTTVKALIESQPAGSAS